jgi:hypothetical protein
LNQKSKLVKKQKAALFLIFLSIMVCYFLLLSEAFDSIVFKFVECKGVEARLVLRKLCLSTLTNASIASVFQGFFQNQ